MKFKRLFFDHTLNLKSISVERLVLALTLGLGSAFFIYSFFYVFRESFRVMSSSFENYPNILSESERTFYNLFFAALSLIFGNSIALSFILGRYQKVFSKHNYKRQRILTDQAFLNLNFLYWFCKIGLVFGIFSICCMDFHFLPFLFYPLILLIIVMYLETWKEVLQCLGKERYKYLLVHFLIFCFLSFALSRINTIDYRSIDLNSQKKYSNVNVPKSNYQNKNRGYLDYYSLDYTLVNDADGQLIIKNYNNNSVDITDINSELNNQKHEIREEHIPLLAVNILADSTTSLLKLKAFEERLFSIQQHRINYVVFNEDDYSRRFIKKHISNILKSDIQVFKDPNSSFYNEMLPPPPNTFFELDEDITYKDTLKIVIKDGLFINKLKVPNDMLVRTLKNHINEETLIEYIILKESIYKDYIWLFSSHTRAVDELRKIHQKIQLEYGEDFRAINKEEFDEEQRYLMRHYPLLKKEVLMDSTSSVE